MQTFKKPNGLIKLKLAIEILKVFSLSRIPSVYKSYTIPIHGTTVSYLKEGKGDALLLIHGWGHSKNIWSSVIPLLSKRYTVYAIDLPNFGDSAISSVHQVPEYAAVIKEFMQKMNQKKYSVVGHSFGSKVAASLFAQDNTHAKKVALYSANITPSHGAFKNFLIFRASYLYSYAVSVLKGKTPAVIAQYKSLKNSHENGDLLEHLIKLKRGKDILFVNGKHDFITPHTMSLEYTKLIPDSKRVIFNNSSHLAHMEEPDLFIAELNNFLSNTNPKK